MVVDFKKREGKNGRRRNKFNDAKKKGKSRDCWRERKKKGGSGLIESNMVGGVPGFLRTRPYPDRTPGSGGNLALKDIAMGLRWVRENIAAFGGDPTKITLIGHDTGAALVNLLLLAPYGKGESHGFYLLVT